MTIEKINPEHIKETLELLHNKVKGSTVVYGIARGRYHIKWGVTKTRIINYTMSFILISTIISTIVWLMK